jgi:hypothetical protein
MILDEINNLKRVSLYVIILFTILLFSCIYLKIKISVLNNELKIALNKPPALQTIYKDKIVFKYKTIIKEKDGKIEYMVCMPDEMTVEKQAEPQTVKEPEGKILPAPDKPAFNYMISAGYGLSKKTYLSGQRRIWYNIYAGLASDFDRTYATIGVSIP